MAVLVFNIVIICLDKGKKGTPQGDTLKEGITPIPCEIYVIFQNLHTFQ